MGGQPGRVGLLCIGRARRDCEAAAGDAYCVSFRKLFPLVCIVTNDMRRLAFVGMLLAVVSARAGAQQALMGVGAGPPPVLETGAGRMPREWVDRRTGHRIVRLSRLGTPTASFYFHNQPFVTHVVAGKPGDAVVVYASPPGGRQIFAIDLKTLDMSQLTNRDGGVTGEIVAPVRREIIYQHGDSLFATHVATRATRLVAVLPPDLRGSIATLNADETLVAGVAAGPEVREILARYPAKGEFFNRIFAAHVPHTLFTVDLRTGALRTIYKESTWLGPLQFSPSDPNLLMFCHEGPWHLVDRIWHIDVRTGTPRLIHKRSVEGEIAGHEFWSRDGRTVWYDLQIPRGVTFYLAGSDVATGRTTRYAMTRDEWSIHFAISPDGGRFAGDGGDSTQVARAHDGRWLYLFRPAGDHLLSTRLVDMRRHDYRLEPNVHFSPGGDWVIFRANFEGESQVYAVETAP